MGQLALRLDPACAQDLEVARGSTRSLEEGSLPDPGLADDEQSAGLAAPRGGKYAFEPLELGRAADQLHLRKIFGTPRNLTVLRDANGSHRALASRAVASERRRKQP